eukprot:1588768-Rhodomonas_salina.1
MPHFILCPYQEPFHEKALDMGTGYVLEESGEVDRALMYYEEAEELLELVSVKRPFRGISRHKAVDDLPMKLRFSFLHAAVFMRRLFEKASLMKLE